MDKLRKRYLNIKINNSINGIVDLRLFRFIYFLIYLVIFFKLSVLVDAKFYKDKDRGFFHILIFILIVKSELIEPSLALSRGRLLYDIPYKKLSSLLESIFLSPRVFIASKKVR